MSKSDYYSWHSSGNWAELTDGRQLSRGDRHRRARRVPEDPEIDALQAGPGREDPGPEGGKALAVSEGRR